MMRHLKTLFVSTLFSFLLLSCSQENDSIDKGLNYTVEGYITANNQIPNEIFDVSENGIYFGVIASGMDKSRGKIWINVGNDDRYNAFVEMVGGKIIQFVSQPGTRGLSETVSTYLFTNSEGSFILDLRNFNEPKISSAAFNDTSYFVNIIKSRSYNRSSTAVTAIFEEIGNPAYGGTWNLISDGSITNPNGINGEGITSLMITMGTQVFIDNSFENYDASYCLGVADFVPTLNANGVTDTVMCDYQATFMAGGIVKWNLGYDPLEEDYIDWRWCEILTAGTFRWTNPASTLIKVGWIILDE
jgi:hypothetical protein